LDVAHDEGAAEVRQDPPPVAARVNIALIQEAVDAMARIQLRSPKLTKTDALNRAIVLYDFFDDLLGDTKGELVWRRGRKEQRVRIRFGTGDLALTPED
jgi:hypothetical protein